MTIAEKREIVNTIINLLLQLTAEEEVQEQSATSSKPVKAPAQSVRMLTIKECTALIEGISEHSIRMLIAQGKIKASLSAEKSGAGCKRGAYRQARRAFRGDRLPL